jgi:hypothetical protein
MDEVGGTRTCTLYNEVFVPGGQPPRACHPSSDKSYTTIHMNLYPYTLHTLIRLIRQGLRLYCHTYLEGVA